MSKIRFMRRGLALTLAILMVALSLQENILIAFASESVSNNQLETGVETPVESEVPVETEVPAETPAETPIESEVPVETPISTEDEVQEAVKYKVTFLGADESELSVQEVEKVQDIEIPTAPERDGFVFKGWDVNLSEITLTEDITVHAIYEEATNKETFKVVFMSDDKEISTQEISKVEDIVIPENPEKEGYTFKEWDVNLKELVLTEDITIRAVFERVLVDKTIETTVDGKLVSITGKMPEDAEIVVTKVTYTDNIETKISDALGKKATIKVYEAFDIKIKVGDEEYQPNEFDEAVKVSIKNIDIEEKTENESIKIFHIDDSDKVEEITASVENEQTSFSADSFSIYVVAGVDYDTADGLLLENEYAKAYFFEEPGLLVVEEFKTETTDGSVSFPWDSKSADIKSIKIKDEVTYISSCAFDGMSNVTSLELGNSIQSIGDCAFDGCTGITGAISFPNSLTTIGNYAFEECSGITSVSFGNQLQSIGDGAFSQCTGITGAISFPDSLTTIGNGAFRSCTGITGVSFPNSLTTIGNYAFEECSGITSVSFGNQLQSIGNYAFRTCTGITGAISFPDSLTTIGNFAFGECIGIPSISLGNQLQSIGENAFSACTGITGAISFPDSLITIGNWAFVGCTGIPSISFGNQLQSIGMGAFYRCIGITGAISFHDSLITIGNGAFQDCAGITGAISFPNSLTTIEDNAFYACKGITSISFGSSLNSLGKYAFADCTNLSGAVSFPSTLTTIEEATFSNTSIQSVNIHDGITSIGKSAFGKVIGAYVATTEINYCLREITLGTGLSSIDVLAFAGNNGLTVIHTTGDISLSTLGVNSFSLTYNSASVPTTIENHIYLNGADTWEATENNVWSGWRRKVNVAVPVGKYTYKDCGYNNSISYNTQNVYPTMYLNDYEEKWMTDNIYNKSCEDIITALSGLTTTNDSNYMINYVNGVTYDGYPNMTRFDVVNMTSSNGIDGTNEIAHIIKIKNSDNSLIDTYAVNASDSGFENISVYNEVGAYIGKITRDKVYLSFGYSIEVEHFGFSKHSAITFSSRPYVAGHETSDPTGEVSNLKQSVPSATTQYLLTGQNLTVPTIQMLANESLDAWATNSSSMFGHKPIGYEWLGWSRQKFSNTLVDFATETFTENASLYPVIDLDEYEIYVNKNDGNGSSLVTSNQQYGQPLVSIADPVVDNREFDGWIIVKGNLNDSYCYNAIAQANNGYGMTAHNPKLLEDVIINGRFRPDDYYTYPISSVPTAFTLVASYKYNFEKDYNDGVTAPVTKSVSLKDSNSDCLQFERTLTREGYYFTGWVSSMYGDSLVNDDSVSTTASLAMYVDQLNPKVTWTATWEQIKYNVYFSTGSGSAVGPQSVAYGDLVVKPGDPVLDGKIFDGWYTDSNYTTLWDFDNTQIYGTATIYAKWKQAPGVVQVSFDTHGGTPIPTTQNIMQGQKVVVPATNPEKEGHTFDGWYTDTTYTTKWDFNNDLVATGMVLHAKWTINSYVISFNTQGGTPVPVDQTLEYGSSVHRPENPEKEGFEFKGWFKDNAGLVEWNFVTDKVDQTRVLFAKWEVKRVTGTFISNGGSSVASQTVDYGEKLTKPADPVKQYKQFSGWYKDIPCTVAFDFNSEVMKENMNIYAKWVDTYSTVSFVTNCSTTLPDSIVANGCKLAKPTGLTNSNLVIEGWYKESSFTNKYDFNSIVTTSFTLYAKWEEPKYTVRFESNGGSAVDSQSVAKNGKVTKPSNPSKDKYSFSNWYKDSSLSTEFDFNTQITADITLYAKWTATTTSSDPTPTPTPTPTPVPVPVIPPPLPIIPIPELPIVPIEPSEPDIPELPIVPIEPSEPDIPELPVTEDITVPELPIIPIIETPLPDIEEEIPVDEPLLVGPVDDLDANNKSTMAKFMEGVKKVVIVCTICIAAILGIIALLLLLLAWLRRVKVKNNKTNDDYSEDEFVTVLKTSIKSEESRFTELRKIFKRNEVKELRNWTITVDEKTVYERYTDDFKVILKKGFCKLHNGENLIVIMKNEDEKLDQHLQFVIDEADNEIKFIFEETTLEK